MLAPVDVAPGFETITLFFPVSYSVIDSCEDGITTETLKWERPSLIYLFYLFIHLFILFTVTLFKTSTKLDRFGITFAASLIHFLILVFPVYSLAVCNKWLPNFHNSKITVSPASGHIQTYTHLCLYLIFWKFKPKQQGESCWVSINENENLSVSLNKCA